MESGFSFRDMYNMFSYRDMENVFSYRDMESVFCYRDMESVFFYTETCRPHTSSLTHCFPAGSPTGDPRTVSSALTAKLNAESRSVVAIQSTLKTLGVRVTLEDTREPFDGLGGWLLQLCCQTAVLMSYRTIKYAPTHCG